MNIIELQTEPEVLKILERVNSQCSFCVVDIETTGLNSFKDSVVDFQFSGVDEDEVYVASKDFVHCLKTLKCLPVGHNLKFDIQFLFRHGVDLTSWQYHDTLLLGHLLDENRQSYSLDSYIKEIWNDNYKEEFWKKYKTYEEAPAEESKEYGAKDVYYTRRLYDLFVQRLTKHQIPSPLIRHVHRLQYSLLQTEIKGIKIDLPYLTDLGVTLKSQIEELKPKMRSLVQDHVELIELEMWERELGKRKTDIGKSRVEKPIFSFDSTKQLMDLLYGKLGLKIQKNEKTRNVSVDDGSLEKIRKDHEVVSLIQDYRGLNKVYGTYIEGTLERTVDGRVYPSFNVAGTVTGRVSHSNPNVGQLPRQGGVRGIYVPDLGNVFISADYSQLEVCLEANLTNDTALRRIFTENLSKHDLTAKELGIKRSDAKTLNFALQYWASHFKVSKLLKVSIDDAKTIWENYWKLYSGPKQLKLATDRLVDTHADIITAFGRRRRFEQRKRSPWDSDYRQAYNFLIQSLGADITSQAFYKISEYLKNTGYGRGLFTVHDEILIEVKEEYAQICENRLIQEMVDVGCGLGLKIPLKAESSGPTRRWED